MANETGEGKPPRLATDGAVIKAPAGIGRPQAGNVIKAPPSSPPKKGK